MPRTFSTRRFTLLYAFAVAAAVALAAFGLDYLRLARREANARRRFEALQHFLVSASREIPADRFGAWLARADFGAWDAPGWNLVWLGPDLAVRWSVHPFDPAALPPDLRAALRDPAVPPPQDLLLRENGRRLLVDVLRLSRADPAAGLLFLRSPLPRFFADAPDVWSAAALLFALLLLVFSAYQRWLLRHVRRIVESSGGAVPASDQPLESWALQHATLASRRLSEERDHFDALFDLLQDGTLVLDADNRVVRANATANELLGDPAASLVGRPLADLADGPALAQLAADIRDTYAYRFAELSLRGGAAPCNAAGVPLHEESGADARPHVLLVLRDVSRIRQLERAGEEYATNVSHELKTPLTLILGYTETLLSHADMEPEFRDRSLRTIEHHAKRILRIIDDLLRLAWLKNEHDAIGAIPRAPVSVATLVDEALLLCRDWARNAGIAIETHLPPGLVWNLNAGLVEEALVNLVKNAILYALVGPVEIRARVLPSGLLELAVVDRGPGLKPEDAQRIFDRFYRADRSRSRASGGSGLGLPIVQQIVEAHGGSARVETAPGEGCTFLLEFPPA